MHSVFRGELHTLPLAIRRATLLTTVGLGSALLWSGAALADNVVQSSSADPAQTPRLNTVTVQGAKITPAEAAKSQLDEVPGGTSVVDSEQVAKGRTATLQDTLAYQPGVFVQSTGGNDGAAQSGSVGLGFAIPIDQARRVAEGLIKTGEPVYAVIGVHVDSSYNGEGAKIATGADAVTAGGPADQAGLRAGDVITKFDDTVVDSSPTLIGEIWQHQPGEKVDLTYTRGGQTRTATVTLGERKGDSTS